MSTNVWDDLLQRASRESSVADMHLIVVGADAMRYGRLVCCADAVWARAGAPAAGKTALVQKLRSLVENRGDGRRGSESEGEDDGEEEEEEEGGRPNPSRAPSSTSASVDTGRACLRYTYFSNAKAEEAEASRSCVHAWLLSDPGKARLLACEPCLAPPSSPLVLLAVDLTDPWSIPASLEQVMPPSLCPVFALHTLLFNLVLFQRVAMYPIIKELVFTDGLHIVIVRRLEACIRAELCRTCQRPHCSVCHESL